jgi:hypothetical protein
LLYKLIFFIKYCLNPDSGHDDEESGAHQHVCSRNLHILKIIKLIKGIVSRDEYFLQVLKIEAVSFKSAHIRFFAILGCVFVKEIQKKISACFYQIIY